MNTGGRGERAEWEMCGAACEILSKREVRSELREDDIR